MTASTSPLNQCLRALIVVLTCMALMASAAPALADSGARTKKLYESKELCAQVRSAANHGTYGWGEPNARIRSLTHYFGSWCGWMKYVDAGYLTATFHWYRWDGSQWIQATSWYWDYNDSRTWSHDTYTSWSRGFGDPVSKWYFNHGIGYVWDSGQGKWQGGGVTSDMHAYPS